MTAETKKAGSWEPPARYLFTDYKKNLIREWHAATLRVINEDHDEGWVCDPALIQDELRTALTLYYYGIAGWHDLSALLDETGIHDMEERYARPIVTLNLAVDHLAPAQR